MTLGILLGAIGRHWKVFTSILAVTILATAATFLLVPVQYDAQAQMVLLTPSNQRDAQGGFVPVNPFLVVGDDAAQVAASAMASIATSQSFKNGLEQRGVTSETTVTVSTSGGGVVMVLDAISTSSETAHANLQVLRDLLVEYLKDRQIEAGAPTTQLYRLADLLGDSAPVAKQSTRLTFTAAAAGGGLAIAILAIVVMASRDRRRTVGDEDVLDATRLPTQPAPQPLAPAPVTPAAAEERTLAFRAHQPTPEPPIHVPQPAPVRAPSRRPSPRPHLTGTRPSPMPRSDSGTPSTVNGSAPSNR